MKPGCNTRKPPEGPDAQTCKTKEQRDMDFLFFFLGLAATIAALCHIKRTS
jgi:hypothetical protein